MATCGQLEAELERIGPWGQPTIRDVRSTLRRARMLQCSRPGRYQPDIVVSNVTELFLGLAAADHTKNAPAVIRLACASRIYLDASENCDPWPFTGISENATLGEFLDALFAGEISSAIEQGFSHWDMRFEFQIVPGDFRFFAKLIFEVGDESYVVQFLGINERIRANFDSEGECELPAPPQVDRVCIVRTEFLRDLIAFTSNALASETGQTVRMRPEASRDNPFSKNGHKHAPSHSSLDGEQ